MASVILRTTCQPGVPCARGIIILRQQFQITAGPYTLIHDWYQRCSRLVYLPVSKLFLLGYVPCLLLLSFLFQQTTIQFCMTFGSRLLPPQFPLPSEKVLINRIAEVSCYLCISSVKN